MTYDMLISIDGISATDLSEILDSEEGAAAYCRRVLTERDAERGTERGTERGAGNEPLVEKLYSPLYVALGNHNHEGEYRTRELSDTEAAQYFGVIRLALQNARTPEEEERGLMTYYHGGGSVDEKTLSATVDIEAYDGRLWGVATLELTEPLTDEETETLKDYLVGQYADGFGESFEQRELKVRDGDLYVHLWDPGDEFFIANHRELETRLGRGDPVADVLTVAAIVETLYSPLEFYLHNPRAEDERGEYATCGTYDDQYKISHSEAITYMDKLELAVRRECDRLDKVRGLAEYVPDALQSKVISLFPSLTYAGDKMYFAAKAELTAPLTADELRELKRWYTGQMSDGFGEGLEQRGIHVDHDTEIYIVPWSSDDSVFFVDTQKEFTARTGYAPPEAASPAVEPPEPPVAPAKTPEEAEKDFFNADGDAYALYAFTPKPGNGGTKRDNYQFVGYGKLDDGVTVDDILKNFKAGNLGGFINCYGGDGGASVSTAQKPNMTLSVVALKQDGAVTPWLVDHLAYSVARDFFAASTSEPQYTSVHEAIEKGKREQQSRSPASNSKPAHKHSHNDTEL